MKLFPSASFVCGGLALVVSSVALYRAASHTPATTIAPCEVAPAPTAAMPSTTIALPASPPPATTPATHEAAAATPAPVAPPAHVAAPGEITVRRLVLARGIENRTPVEPGTTFHAGDDRIYAFMEVDNRSSDTAPLVVTFVPESGRGGVGMVQLDVPSAHHWRTWAFTRGIRRPGLWTAVVRTADGHEVARAPFEVTAG